MASNSVIAPGGSIGPDPEEDEHRREDVREPGGRVGARGLRMILEELMLDLMYHLPGQKKVKEFEVTREMVEKRDVSFAMVEKQAS